MIAIQQQTEIRPNFVVAPDAALAQKFRPFANDILAWGGIDERNDSLDRAKTIVGWIASHAIHPDDALHPNGHTDHIDVLPAGETWTSFNAEFDNVTNISRDLAYWYALFPDGITMAERLIGTVDANGNVADDGMLTRDSTLHWRIRNFTSFRAVQCTLQCKIAQPLLAAVGIHSIDLSTTSHDPMAVFIAEMGRWIYIDPTFGEVQMLDDALLSPLDLITLCLSGRADEIVGARLPGADYLVGTYFEGDRLPAGMQFMTVHTAPHWAGGSPARSPHRFGSLPSASDYWDVSGSASQIMPQLGCGFAGVTQSGQTPEVRLVSNWPGHAGFERSADAGANWAACSAIDYPAEVSGQILYRSIDALGWSGQPSVLSL